ncbi:MAG: 50S ribosomal protein L23 [Candidatus Doudnabacteria bacterium RIFCSPHIGHO2_01_FULL_46_14]|uniref:Large ribosomal subunit protein uL23 n=1 Tax=Candidatus Doudnabacteria bacterium RIFCSPHIGHO2_01_FULL_46_14 TaxID=1817824 RepID=A0A1F5NKY8_9BACT|nr:MAG: 50S ribosomal protein L23 [Candidatus Doudnabacteria bacterium RIFCSPHIGHO2_01_FULL_46_14]
MVSHASEVLVKPLLSEKGTHLASTGRYVFMVKKQANKPEIKKSIQRVYKVHVEGIRIVNLPAKKRRYGRASGQTSEHKKAIITLKKGEKIPGIIESVG